MNESDCRVEVFTNVRGSSAVVTHVPTGESVACSDYWGQAANRIAAMARLREVVDL